MMLQLYLDATKYKLRNSNIKSLNSLKKMREKKGYDIIAFFLCEKLQVFEQTNLLPHSI